MVEAVAISLVKIRGNTAPKPKLIASINPRRYSSRNTGTKIAIAKIPGNRMEDISCNFSCNSD